jgi:hypothetical protein
MVPVCQDAPLKTPSLTLGVGQAVWAAQAGGTACPTVQAAIQESARHSLHYVL